MSRFLPTVLALLLTAATPLVAADRTPSARSEMSEPIAYTVRFPAPETHYAEIEARFPTDGKAELELMMAVWTPGSYLVREYSRQVEALAAHAPDGSALALEKVAKNRWRVATGGAPRVVVAYRLYCREMSVRTNFVDASFAILNGAPSFLTLADPAGPARPHEVTIVPPAAWKAVVSPLPAAATGARGGEHRFRAASFDELVDSPIYAGNARLHRFEVAGKEHLLLVEGEQDAGNVWDGERATRDSRRVVEELARFWGDVPYPRYVIFNLLTETGGGLEHKDSTVLMASRFASRTRDGYVDWLSLVCHEVFHAWNVKRLRPVELGPFDYEHEVYTTSLWQVEGMTSYYDDLLVHRAGLSTRDEYLKRLSRAIESTEGASGHKVQSLENASFDAWIKYYRRDENFANTGVNYYSQGAVASFLLDAEIRRATAGGRSLDDVLHRLYERYSGERGFRPAELAATISEVAGKDLGPYLDRLVGTTGDFSYGAALAWYGLRFVESAERGSKAGAEPPAATASGEVPAWLGVDTEVQDGRLVVTQVPRGTPGQKAGINVGDEILAIGDYRVPPHGLDARLKAYRPGEEGSVLVARRDRLQRIPVVFGEKIRQRGRLAVDPEATPEQRAHLEAWLAGSGKERS
jgi:predicted metalloprotease with PDZ domain